MSLNAKQAAKVKTFAKALAAIGYDAQVKNESIRLVISPKKVVVVKPDFDAEVMRIRCSTLVKGEWTHSSIRAASKLKQMYRVLRRHGAHVSVAMQHAGE